MCLFREAIIHSAGTCDGGYSTLRNCKENKNVPISKQGGREFVAQRKGQCKAAKNQKDESDGAKSQQRRSAVRQRAQKKVQSFEFRGYGERETKAGRNGSPPGAVAGDVSVGFTLVTSFSPASVFLSQQYF